MPLSERSQLIGEPARREFPAKFVQFLNKLQWQHILYAGAVTGFLALFVVALSGKSHESVLQAAAVNSNLQSPTALKLTLDSDNEIDSSMSSQPMPQEQELPSSPSQPQPEIEGFTFTQTGGSSPGLHLLVQKLVLNVSEIPLALTEERARELVSVDIRTELIVGDYSRIYTPKLKDFRFNLSGPGDDIETAGNFFYRQPEGLKEILFFELQPLPPNSDPMSNTSTSWDLVKDITNLGVSIFVSIRTTNLVNIDRPKGLIELNADYGWSVLENTKGTYEKLALVSCPFAQSPNDPPALTFSPNLKYLNLFNITNPSKSGPVKFSSFFKAQNQNLGALQTLIIYQYAWASPTLETSLNLADLPQKSLKKITFRGVGLTLQPELSAGTFMSPVTDLTLEDNDYSTAILENFPTIFQNTKMLRLFALKSDPDNLLYRAISSLKSVYRILVTEADRDSLSPRTNELLTSFGVAPTAQNFALIRDYSSYANGPNAAPLFIANEVTYDDWHHERYTALGFPDLEEYEHYINHI